MGFVVGFLWLAAALAVPPKGLRVNRALRTTHSRRECNRFIAEGRLLVNGVAAVNPDDRLAPGDHVQLDGEEVAWMEDEIEPHRYIKFNKPAGVVCTTDRRVPGNINDAFESFGGGSSKHNSNATRRVYPIGRLDAESTGLILLTSDGSIVNPLLRSGEKKVKEYHVMTEPCATDAHILQLAAGIVITTKARKDGGMADVTAKTLPCTVERIDATINTGTRSTNASYDNKSAALRFVLGEGRNRQIRRMCAAVGIEVTSLHRVGFAGISLQGCENAGDWASLTEAEELTIGARKGPTRNELRTPEERARRKAKKLAKKQLK
eukprot:scaffold123514_cov54-Attheya_sp.AAC.1